jgi:aldehyde:ferredoxin oxidoreductase
MEATQKVLSVDASTGYYRMWRYPLRGYFGPVYLGLHLSVRQECINIGVGLFAGSILPGSNRLIVNGISQCWRGFYVSSMGAAGLVFENLGINMVSIVGKATDVDTWAGRGGMGSTLFMDHGIAAIVYGGTLGVNCASVGGRLIPLNYRSVSWTEAERLELHKRLVLEHYLRQFNEETIATRNQATCGEPCTAVCKKLNESLRDFL